MSDRLTLPAHLYPKPGALLLLLRAALAPTRDASPYLVIQRAAAGVYKHYVTVHKPGAHMDAALMLTGPEALSHAYYAGWDSVIDPTVRQLRHLAVYAVDLREIRNWEDDYALWNLTSRTASWEEREREIEQAARAGAMLARDRWSR